MKLAVNLVIAATNQSVAEAMALAESCGIGRASAYETLASSAVASPFLGHKRDSYLHPGTAPVAFSAALMGKDLALAIGVAGETRPRRPLPPPGASSPKRARRAWVTPTSRASPSCCDSAGRRPADAPT
jgi:3-hydroxyisobutyrate dehydrogenase-like beta-hydroxyacid dehydrogenase